MNLKNLEKERELNQREYQRLKKEINQVYPVGQYVAIVRGKVVANAATFRELITKLEPIEKNPNLRFVVQAGVEYPKKEIIRKGMCL